MFTWGKGCKHTLFFESQGSRQQAAGSRQHRKHPQSFVHNLLTWHREASPPELCAQFAHMAHSFTTRTFCAICSQWHAAHSLRASCLP